jgi:predicted kinase
VRERSPEVVFLVGLPASGKSSFCRKHFASSHILISKDLMKNRKRREDRQLRLLSEALNRGESVVIDNTNISVSARFASLQLAKSLRARTRAFYFPIALDDSRSRNLGPGRTKVPEVAIYVAAKSLEPPTCAEGFDEVIVVGAKKPIA